MTSMDRAALASAYMTKRAGQLVDVTGAYGPQSPDLAMDYLHHLTGQHLRPVGNAMDWRYGTPCGDTVAQVADWHPNPEHLTGKAAAALHGDTPWVGDLVVYGAAPGLGSYGTLGVCLQVLPGKSLAVECFTQSPHPAGLVIIASMPLLGWWRVRESELKVTV